MWMLRHNVGGGRETTLSVGVALYESSSRTFFSASRKVDSWTSPTKNISIVHATINLHFHTIQTQK